MSGVRAAVVAWVGFGLSIGVALASPTRVADVDEYFARLPERFVAAEAAGFTGAIQWDIPGQGSWHAEVRDGALVAVVRGAHPAPDLRFRMKADDLVGLANGDLSGRWLYLSSRIQIDGSLVLAQRVGEFLPSLR